MRGTQAPQILGRGQGGCGFLIPAFRFRGVPGLLGRPSQRQQQIRHQGKIRAPMFVQPVIAFHQVLAGAPEVPLGHLDLAEETTGPGKLFDHLRRFGDLLAPAEVLRRPVMLLEAGQGRCQPDLTFGLTVEVVLSLGQGQRGGEPFARFGRVVLLEGHPRRLHRDLQCRLPERAGVFQEIPDRHLQTACQQLQVVDRRFCAAFFDKADEPFGQLGPSQLGLGEAQLIAP